MDWNWQPFVGLFLIGPAMQVVVPYLRKGLEMVADGKAFPLPNWGYLALFLMPVLEYGVAFAITEGLPQVVNGWTMVYAIAFAYAGSHFGKEAVMAAAAVVKIARKLL